MPAAHPTVTSAPRPSDLQPSGSANGLSLVGNGADGPFAIPADFHYAYYVQRMLALIASRWYKPPAPPSTSARVRFRILRGGQLDGILLEETSGIPSFDRATLRALYAANPLPPLPPAYGKSSLTVHLTFSE